MITHTHAQKDVEMAFFLRVHRTIPGLGVNPIWVYLSPAPTFVSVNPLNSTYTYLCLFRVYL